MEVAARMEPETDSVGSYSQKDKKEKNSIAAFRTRKRPRITDVLSPLGV